MHEPMPSALEIPSPPPRPTFSPWVLVGGFGCLGIMLLLAFFGIVYVVRPATPLSGERGLQTRKMPDGTFLSLEQVTYGNRHDFEFQKVQRHGPAWFQVSSVQKRHVHESTPHAMLVVWLSRRDQNGQPLDFEWWSHNVAVDEFGNTFEDDDAGRTAISNHSQSGYSGSRPFAPVGPGTYELIVARSALRPFRHAGHSFKLRVFDTTGAQVAEFDVPDPVTGPFPEWTPENLPATKTDGDLAVTLTSLGSKQHQRDESGRKRQVLQLSPQFEFHQAGRRAPEWRARRSQLSDALGNVSDTWDVKLSPRESACKLHVHLARNESGTFAADEQATFGPLTLPGKDVTELVGRKQTLQGVTLELLAVGGPGQITYTDKAPPGSGGSHHNGFWMEGNIHGEFVTRTENGQFSAKVDAPIPHVLFRITGNSGEFDLSLTAIDDQQRPVTVQPAQNGEMHLWALKPAEGALSFQCTLTVQKMRSVEFVVPPPQVK